MNDLKEKLTQRAIAYVESKYDECKPDFNDTGIEEGFGIFKRRTSKGIVRKTVAKTIGAIKKLTGKSKGVLRKQGIKVHKAVKKMKSSVKKAKLRKFKKATRRAKTGKSRYQVIGAGLKARNAAKSKKKR